jgi:hypothetical protein
MRAVLPWTQPAAVKADVLIQSGGMIQQFYASNGFIAASSYSGS